MTFPPRHLTQAEFIRPTHKRHRTPATIAREKRTHARQKAQREEWMRAGLDSHGKRFASYASWRNARSHAPGRWRIDALDREYPEYFSRLDDETTLEAIQARKEAARKDAVHRNILYQQRKRQYLREDIVTGDEQVKSYAQFVGFMERYKRASPYHDSELTAALRRQYPDYYRRYLDNKRSRKKKGKR